MAVVGKVVGIWRHPVKSMRGEALSSTEIRPDGLAGDRGWAVRDDAVGEIRGAKKLPDLLRCAARYLDEPAPGRVAVAEIELPDGSRVRSDSPDVARLLSALLGRAVSLWPRLPAESREHYRRVFEEGVDPMEDLREIFGRLPEEPLPDLSVFPPELFELTSPAGTYFDAFPLHVVTTGHLDFLRRRNPGSAFDPLRFRPNLLVETVAGADAPPELDWCGRELRIGGATIAVTVPCPRCVMTTLPQGDLPKDPAVLRTIVRDSGQNVGVYATIASAGTVSVGDAVELS
ncbi:MAG: MOSC domain-containing protein [Alphaproteobacteria bacterium]